MLGYTPEPGAPSLEEQEQACAVAFMEYAAASAANSADSFGAPAALDWRNNGGNFVTPVKNQVCNSCKKSRRLRFLCGIRNDCFG